MHVYFSGIGGVGLGPLAEIAYNVGYSVSGSDIQHSAITDQLGHYPIHISIGQSGEEIMRCHSEQPIDWFVYTAALPEQHPELVFARQHHIKISKRDELLAAIVHKQNLKLIAIAGTHGKTTTTSMFVWALRTLHTPISYSVGSTLRFAPSGNYDPKSQYFIYECDEYDRNFLQFMPDLSIIPSIDYDHPDTYPTRDDYTHAFIQFLEQSTHSLLWKKDFQYLSISNKHLRYTLFDEHAVNLSLFTLAGIHVRQNAFLVMRAIERLFPNLPPQAIIHALNNYPGSGRRFERLADNLYSDYGHHPVEIAATLQLAHEIADHIVLVYQPHQNSRQHEVRHQYATCMQLAETIYWLPTYLSREDPSLPVLRPEELSAQLTHTPHVHPATMNDELWRAIQTARHQGKLVLVMGAGSVDTWLHTQLRRNQLET